jgi:hypothetical protein
MSTLQGDVTTQLCYRSNESWGVIETVKCLSRWYVKNLAILKKNRREQSNSAALMQKVLRRHEAPQICLYVRWWSSSCGRHILRRNIQIFKSDLVKFSKCYFIVGAHFKTKLVKKCDIFYTSRCK